MKFAFEWSHDMATDVGGCIVDWDEDCIVNAQITGKYRAATREEPEEYCEVEILSVMVARPKIRKTLVQGANELIDLLEEGELTEGELESIQRIAEEKASELVEDSMGGPEYDLDKAYEDARQREIDNE